MIVELEFSGALWYWRGPPPFHFITVPEDECDLLRDASELVSYGWGMVPVGARIGDTTWSTSLWPKDGGYIVPVKAAVRDAEGLDEGMAAQVQLFVRADP